MNIETIKNAMIKRAARVYDDSKQPAQMPEKIQHAQQANLQTGADYSRQMQEVINRAQAPSAPFQRLDQTRRGIARAAAKNPGNARLQQLANPNTLYQRTGADVLGNAFGKALDQFGHWVDNKAIPAIQKNAPQPQGMPAPTWAEKDKADEIYYSRQDPKYGWTEFNARDWGARIPGSVLREPTTEQVKRLYDKKEQISARQIARLDKRLAAQAAKERFQRQQADFQLNLDLARGASSPERRDEYLREAGLLPPRDGLDELIRRINTR